MAGALPSSESPRLVALFRKADLSETQTLKAAQTGGDLSRRINRLSGFNPLVAFGPDRRMIMMRSPVVDGLNKLIRLVASAGVVLHFVPLMELGDVENAWIVA